MKKQELAKRVAERAGLDNAAQAAEVIDITLEAMKQELAGGGPVRLRSFGTFAAVERKARSGRNPRTGAIIAIPARKAVIFKPGNELKVAANSPHFGLEWLDFKDISRSMGEIKEKIEAKFKNSDQMGADARKYLENAQQLYEDAGGHLKKAADSGGKAWTEVRIGLDKAFGELKTAWKKAKDNF